MSDRLMAVLAFAVFAGFLGILAWKVPSADLVIVIALTLVLALYDVWRSAFRRKDG